MAADALGSDPADARRVLVLWLARKWSWAFALLASTFGLVVSAIREEQDRLEIDWGSPDALADDLLSPWGGLVLP